MTILLSTSFESDAHLSLPAAFTILNDAAWQVLDVNSFAGALPVTGNKAFGRNTAGQSCHWNGNTTLAAQGADFAFKLVNGSYCGAFLRVQLPNADRGYLCYPQFDGTNLRAVIDMRSNGLINSTASAYSIAAAVGQVFRFQAQAVGSVIEVRLWPASGSRPDTPTVSYTDSSYTSGAVAFRRVLGSEYATLDDLSISDDPATDFSGGPTGPTINTQPSNASVTAPTAATFTAAATSSGGTLLRQWFRRTGGTGDGAEVTSGTGGTTDSYNTGTTAVSGGNANNGDQYRCRYRDDNGDTFTNWVTLTVTVPLATAAPISCPEHASQSGFSGVVLSAAAPGAGVTVLQTFTGLSLNGSGAANVSVLGLGQAVGAVRYVIGTQSDGNLAPGTNPRCFQGPVALT